MLLLLGESTSSKILVTYCCFYLQVAVKEEDILDSDILTHISGVNSFSYNFTLESWI